VKPEGSSFDDLGRGEEEGIANIRTPDEVSASKSLEVLKQISSTGYLRKRLPQEFRVLQGGAGATALALDGDPLAVLQTLVPATSGSLDGASAMAVGAVSLDPRAKARMQGYEGDPCGECGNYTLVRNGTCMKCNTCGGTSGCS
jgi:ribonucleoside-diphosphate reductase alpha chain